MTTQKRYTVVLYETVFSTIHVEAASKAEARRIARDMPRPAGVVKRRIDSVMAEESVPA